MIALGLVLALQGSTPAPRLITVEQLADRLQEPNLVLLHVGDQRSRPLYDQGHIVGAQFLEPLRELAAPAAESNGLRLEMPSAAQLDSVLEGHGVSDDSWVVLIPASGYFTPTTRAVLTLEYAGLAGKVSVLDGGLEAWTAAGKPVTTTVPPPSRGRLTVRLNRALIVDASYLAQRLDTPGMTIVDARDTSFYRGAETRQGRNGHIPGAVNLPFSTMTTADGRFKDITALQSMFQQAGVPGGNRVVTYCHIGQQASLLWFVATLAGYDAVLYDGSFQDWAGRPELPVAERP